MIYYNADKAMKFEWCNGYSFDSAKAVAGAKMDGMVRLCFLTTEVYRMYLAYIPGSGYEWRPYVYRDNALRLLDHHLWRIRPVPDDIWESEEKLRSALEFQMVLQWRNSPEGYYDQHPSAEEIMASLGEHATTETLDFLRYTYGMADVQRDPEWDGAVEVFCDEGSLLIPFVGGEDDAVKSLLLGYATFVPDSRVGYAATKFVRALDRVSSWLSNVHWSSIRSRVDRVGGNHSA